MNEPTKICSKCKTILPATNEYFSRSKQHPSGLYPSCKICKSKKDKADYPSKQVSINARVKQYASTRKNEKQKYDKQYRVLNKTKIATNKKAQFALYKNLHPEKVKQQNIIRTAKRRAKITKHISVQELNKLINRSQQFCSYCGCKTDKDNPLEIDHIIPLARGGRHSIGNFAVSCLKCNRSKNHRFIMEWRIGKVVPRKNENA